MVASYSLDTTIITRSITIVIILVSAEALLLGASGTSVPVTGAITGKSRGPAMSMSLCGLDDSVTNRADLCGGFGSLRTGSVFGSSNGLSNSADLRFACGAIYNRIIRSCGGTVSGLFAIFFNCFGRSVRELINLNNLRGKACTASSALNYVNVATALSTSCSNFIFLLGNFILCLNIGFAET